MTFYTTKINSSMRSFPDQSTVSYTLRNQLPKDINTKEKEKVIKVVSKYFANQDKTKNSIRIESGLLLEALAENSEKKPGFEDLGIAFQKKEVLLPREVINKLRGPILIALLNSTTFVSYQAK